MRLLLISNLFLALSFNSQAQIEELFENKKADLSDWEANITNEEKRQFIEPLKSLDLFEWPFYNLESCESCIIESFHIIDFDLDGINDVLYYGLLGGESTFMVLMKKSNQGFKEVLSIAGSLTYISPKSNLTPPSFGIKQFGCCMDMVNQYELYHPIWNNGSITYQLALKYGFPYGTQFPRQTIDPIAFETINPDYKLRLTPKIDDGSSELDDPEFPGNVLAVYPKGSEGIAIAESTDNTGRTWWFVLMKNNLNPKSSVMHDGANNSDDFYTMGWMSSRFVKRN